MNKAIAALSTGLSVVALGAAIAWAQTFTMPPPAGVVLIGCTYNAAPPTLTSGQVAFAQCDSTGHIAPGGGGGGGGAITGPLGPSTAPVSAVAITDTGTPITGQTLGAGGQGLTGWMSQVVAAITNNLLPTGTAGTPATTVLTVQGISGATPLNTTSNTAQVNGITTLTGAGATGTGSQRVTAAQDTTTIAGSAPGVAGTPSSNVLTIQGAASMTKLLVTPDANSTVNAQPTPVTAGGLSVYFVQPTASDNHANIKNGAGQVYKVSVTNNSATVNYLRLYNAGTGFNGCNSATNLVYQMAIPANVAGAGFSDSWDLGIAFATGISICVTSGYAQTDVTNATASAMSVNIGYK